MKSLIAIVLLVQLEAPVALPEVKRESLFSGIKTFASLLLTGQVAGLRRPDPNTPLVNA